MNSEELFEKGRLSKHGRGKTSLETRALYAARKNSLASFEEKTINKTAMIQAIETGEAFKFYMVGHETIKVWCMWVTGELELPEGITFSDED